MHYFAHAEHKAYPSHGIGQLQKQPVIFEALAYCGKETQTLYSYSEDGESNGTTLIGEEQAQIFQIGAPEELTIDLKASIKTLLNLGVPRDQICKAMAIPNKTLSNILSGQLTSQLRIEHYVRLFQRVCIERKLLLEDFNSSNLQPGSVSDELRALTAQGWTVPKIAHELGKSERQVYRWLEGAKCKRKLPRQVDIVR